MKKETSDRQIEIIEAAGKLLMEKGIKGLTTKSLAQEMKFSESALYRHFKDKEAIIVHFISYLSENINTRFENILNSELNAEEKLTALFKSQFSFFNVNPHYIVIVLSDGLLDDSEVIKNEILKLIQTNVIVFLEVIKEGQKTNTFNQEIDAEYLVHFAIGSFRLQMLQWKLANFSYDIEKKGIETMNNLLMLFKK